MELNPPQLLLGKPRRYVSYIMHSTLKPLFSQQKIYSSCFSSELHTSASPRQSWWTQWQLIFLTLTETWQAYSRASTCSCYHRVSYRYVWKCNLPSQSLFTVSCWSNPCNWRPLVWRWKAILALSTSLPGTFSPNWSCRVQTGSDLDRRRSQICAWENHVCSKRTGICT